MSEILAEVQTVTGESIVISLVQKGVVEITKDGVTFTISGHNLRLVESAMRWAQIHDNSHK